MLYVSPCPIVYFQIFFTFWNVLLLSNVFWWDVFLKEDNIKAPYHWFFVGIPTRGSPHKGPVMRKAFPSHGVRICFAVQALHHSRVYD